MKSVSLVTMISAILLLGACQSVSVEQMPGSITAPGTLTEVASVEGITEYRLDNGLRVILFPDASRPTITVNINYLVGSRHEGYGESGMAHLLEHLVFKGTPGHPDIPKEQRERGASANGSTSVDRTNYFETFPASDENLEWALDLESDRMVNSFISADDLASEMTVVRNEMERRENSPGGMLSARVRSTAYLWHNYGQATIGARSDVENVPIERLQAFYRKYYQPDNAVLVIAGKYDKELAKKLVAEKFGRIPRPDRTGNNRIYPTYTTEPTQDGERSVTLRRSGDIQLVMASYHVPAGPHEDFAALDILAHALFAPPSGRLHKALVETGMATRVSAGAPHQREASTLMVSAQVRADGALDEVWDTMQSTIYATASGETPITDEEVERARAYFLNDLELLFNNSQRTAISLSLWAALGDWRLLFLYRDNLQKVTREDVQRVAAAYLKPQNSTVGFFIPTDEPDRAVIPASPDVTALVADYRGREAVKAGEAFDPSPENIDARVIRVTLANGFQLAMLPKETRGQNVNVSLQLLLGSEEKLFHLADVGSLTGGMLMRGTKRMSRQALTDEFTRLKSRGGVSGGVNSAGGSIQTIRENLPEVLRLIGEVLRQPSFDENQFTELRQQTLAGLEAQRTDPQTLAMQALNRHLKRYPEGHPRYVSTLDESISRIEAIELNELVGFHTDFYGAAAGQLAIVGDFDPAEIEPVVAEIFGNWNANEAYVRVTRAHFEVAPEKKVINTPDKANAIFVLGINLRLRDDHADYPALVLGNYMLGVSSLSSRLGNRIRQEEGLSYSVGSQLTADPIDATGAFFGYAIYAPENAAALEAAFLDELNKVRRDGFSAEEVSAAKSGYIQSRKNSRSNDRNLASALSRDLFLGRTMAWTTAFEEQIQALTPEDIRGAMARHLDLDKVVIVAAGDFEKQVQ